MDTDVVENVLFFVGENLEYAVFRSEFVSSNAAAAFEYIENNRLEATYQVFRVVTRTKLSRCRPMTRNEVVRTC